MRNAVQEMSVNVDDQVKLVLQLKVCSARKLGVPINAFVAVGFGSWSRQTSVKKHTDRPIWNETFTLPVEESDDPPSLVLQLMHKDLIGKAQERGQAVVPLPLKINELVDTWVKLEAAVVSQSFVADLHICLQLEPMAGRSMETLLGRQSARGSLMRFGGSSMRLLGTLGSSSHASEVGTGDSRVQKDLDASNFAVKAGAVTLNEICQNLDRLRGIIYLSGSEVTRSADDRVGQLQKAKVELDDLEDQVGDIDGLSEEWKDKLAALIEDYARDCWKMLSDESWERLTNKRQSSRAPPPLPPKATMDRIRKERLSLVSGSEVPKSSVPLEPKSSARSVEEHSKGPSSTDRQHVVVVKDHFLSSLDEFDNMMDFGYSIERFDGKDGPPASSGDLTTFILTSFVYDAVICKIVSYDGPTQISHVLGSQHPDIPKGLDAALARLPAGVSRCLVTVAPEWGFGDDGHEGGVPPNSTLVFCVEQFTFRSKGFAEDRAELLPGDRSSVSVLAKAYGTFPAREPHFVLKPAPRSPKAPSSSITDGDSMKASSDVAGKVATKSVQPGLMAELNVRLSRRASNDS